MSKSKTPLISVYITSYNYENYLQESIDSVKNQTLKNFELLIIDDGSTDNSRQIIKKNLSPKIKCIFQKRKGLNVTNNIAIKNTSGKYVVRLDADDCLCPDALKKMSAALEKDKKAAMVFPDYYETDKDLNVYRKIHRHNFEEVTLYDLPAHGACTMIRREVLEEVGGYDEDFDRQDGYDIWLKIVFKHKILNLNEPLFYYRQHNINLTSNFKKLLKVRSEIKNKFTKKKESKKTLAVVPFRGNKVDPGSTPLKKLAGRALLEWTLDETLKANKVNKIIASSPDKKSLNFIKKNYKNKVSTHFREKSTATLNSGIESVLLNLIDEEERKNLFFDVVLILDIDYPFKEWWQIDEAVDTLSIFDADAVDGIIEDDRSYYRHFGKGLIPVQKMKELRRERDKLYKRVGGVYALKVDSLKKTKSLSCGVISHIYYDQSTAFKISTDLDFDLARKIANKKK